MSDQHSWSGFRFAAYLFNICGIFSADESPRTQKIAWSAGIEQNKITFAEVKTCRHILKRVSAAAEILHHLLHCPDALWSFHITVVITRGIYYRDTGIAQWLKNLFHGRKFARLSGTGQIPGAYNEVNGILNHILNQSFESPQVKSEPAAEGIIKDAHPPFIEIRQPVFGAATGVWVGKMHNSHA